MKIIHTYIPAGGANLDKTLIYYLTLSVLLAKRHYHNIVLYTNDEIGTLIKKIGIPYTEINTELLNGVNLKTFSIPKMMVYAVQDEPFIHIDLDTFIYDKINFGIQNIYSTYQEGSEKMIGYNKSDVSFYNTYVKNAFLIQKNLPPEFTKHVKFSEIMNMSVFGGHKYELIAEASKYCLGIYEQEKDFFDTEYYNACIIEQLFVTSAIRMLLEDENEGVKHETSKSEFNFLFKTNPTVINFKDDRDLDYPFEIVSVDEMKEINNEHDLFRNSLYEFGGFMHLCGYKGFDKLMFFIREKILFDFIPGGKYLSKIDKYFPEELPVDILHKKYLTHLSDKISPYTNKII